MKFPGYLRSLTVRFLHRSRIEEDIEEELRFHLQHRADDLEAAGLERAEAERRARLEFGGPQRFKEECREALGGNSIETLGEDIRFSLRLLRKSPGFTFVAVSTLALGIGANAVVFAALNALILRPLDLPRAESLYSVHRVTDNSANQSYPDYLDLRDRNRSFEDLAAYNILQAGLDTGDNPSRVWLLAVSGNYFDVLGVQPHLGRYFHDSDEHGPNSAPYIVLSHAYWHSRFHEDRSVVGRTVQVNKHPFTILGVAPPGFRGTLLFFSPDFFMPMVNQEELEGVSVLNARGNRWVFMTMGHLKAGITPEQAAADFNSISATLEKTYPKEHGSWKYSLARPGLYGEYLGGPVRAFLTALMLLAGLILLAACANLGSLFAARAADRSREVALRLALGASRLRLLRQLFTEAILISLMGGAVGLWGSVWLLDWLRVWNPFSQFPIYVPVSPDAKVYGVALLLALASGFLFGAVPVRQVLHTNPYEIIRAGSAGRAGRRIPFRDVLLVGQISICALLVTSSMVALRGLARTLHADFGFQPRHAMLISTGLGMAGYRGDTVPAMQRRMIEAMEAIPGVSSVGLVDWVPLTTGDGSGATVFTDATTDLRPANATAAALMFTVSPGYFHAAETALLSGRNLTWHDEQSAPSVAVINREFARRIFGSPGDALGGYFKRRDGTRIQVVGIVEDGKYESLTESSKPAMFLPLLQSPTSEMSLIVRSDGDPRQLAAAMRNKLRELDAGLPCFIQTWSQAMSVVLFPSRVASVALGVLGVMAAMLSITGIFGIAAYSVGKRIRELGIRMALGAQRKEVLQAALGRPFKLLAWGSAAGLLLGLLAARVLAFLVYQATPRDPLVLTGVVVAMMVLGLVATWIPAQRALSISPLILLRDE
ncbi:MAG TPA: ABC transporter permease [Candidatus Polarisedimenticolia bacterium]|jgi:predicted permease|nr:ABC transporter permease [Candidatus Polarisedimenticolia bacterium]